MKNGPEHTQLGSDTVTSQAAGDTLVPERQMEAALHLALQPAQVPPGFGERVLARAYAGERPTVAARPDGAARGKLLQWPHSRLWVTGAVAAGLLAGIFEGGVALEHVREQRRKIVEATQQFQTTERITVHALAQAREQLQRAGVQLTVD